MTVEFDKSFEKSLDKIRNKRLYQRIERIIIDCEAANSINEIQNVKKIIRIQELLPFTIGRLSDGYRDY